MQLEMSIRGLLFLKSTNSSLRSHLGPGLCYPEIAAQRSYRDSGQMTRLVSRRICYGFVWPPQLSSPANFRLCKIIVCWAQPARLKFGLYNSVIQ